jgi:hypothetical protein
MPVAILQDFGERISGLILQYIGSINVTRRGLVSRLFDVLGSDHPRAVQQKRIRRYKGDSFDYLLTNNPDEWRDQLITEFPHDQKGIEAVF